MEDEDVSIPPNQTVANLDASIEKQKLRRALYTLFSAYGRIMDVVALKTMKMRGQAFVVFTVSPFHPSLGSPYCACASDP